MENPEVIAEDQLVCRVATNVLELKMFQAAFT
jgi:hypothetical protein